jgi:hypothetical protein
MVEFANNNDISADRAIYRTIVSNAYRNYQINARDKKFEHKNKKNSNKEKIQLNDHDVNSQFNLFSFNAHHVEKCQWKFPFCRALYFKNCLLNFKCTKAKEMNYA